MKLTAVLLFIACMQVAARTDGQTVTISVRNAPLKEIFRQIQKQTGMNIMVKESLLEKAEKVTIDVKDMPVNDVLNLCLKNMPLNFTIENGVIVIQQKPVIKDANETTQPPPPIDITGRITNEHGEPLSGASVIIKRTGKGDIADANGNFKLHNVNNEDIIEISFTGYKKQIIKIGDRTNFTLILEVAVDELDRAVVQAYGKTTQRVATGDIAKVTAEEIEKQPVINPLLALQGRVAGLDVTQVNGFASAPIKVELRGRSAINGQFTSDPLYIIDGVPLTVLELSGNSGYTTGSYGFLQSGMGSPANGQSPFFNINPADIESIEVLKDADATAIYGSRGANGVILITTKKGKAGKTQFNLHINEGIEKVTKYWHMMNTSQYLQMRHEAYNNDGIVPDLSNGAYDLLSWDTTRFTDWQKALYGGTGKNIDVQASLSGGDSHTTFRIGGGYTRTTNILTVSGADQRGSMSLSLGHHSTDQRFSIAASTNYSFTQTDMISLPQNAVILPPNAPSIYDSAGNLNYAAWGDAYTSSRSLFSFGALKMPYTSKTNFLNSNLNLNFELVKGLNFSSNFGYNNALAVQQLFTPISSQDPMNSPTGSSQFGNNRNTNWIVEPQINYHRFLSKGNFSFLVGGSIQQTTTNGTQTFGDGYISDDLIRSISNAPSQYSTDRYGEYKYAAVFGRINYNWRNKYILNLNGRRDGSSRFGKGKQFGNFGDVGAAWIFTEESWLKKHLRFMSFGKLQGSYGTTGSDAVGDYGYLTRWSSNGLRLYGVTQPLAPIQHANPNYHWQTNRKLEGSINLGLLKDKIILNVAYYRNRCGDQLVPFPTPRLSGFSSVIANSPALVQNAGWEFTLFTKIIEGKNFSWGVNFNTSINKNKLLAYPNIEQSPYASSLVVGQSLNIIKLFHYIGVDPQTGDYMFADKDKNGQFDLLDLFNNNLSPKFFGGLGMNFNYKNFQLDLFFNIKKQIGANAYFLGGSNAGDQRNYPVEIIGKEWRMPGDQATISRFATQPNNSLSGNSDLGFTDASFIRLSTLSISYNLPASYTKKLKMQGCLLFIHTNDVFIITKYKGLDPETQNFGGMPPARTLVGGIDFNF